MRIEHKVIFTFEKQDLVIFNKWKKKNHYSLRKIGKEIGISYTYIEDMIKGRKAINKLFYEFLRKNVGELFDEPTI